MDDLVKRLSGIADVLTNLFPEFSKDINAAADLIEQLEEALRLGVDMREKQKAYFKRRFQDVLLDCKKAERDFDVSALAALGEKKDD